MKLNADDIKVLVEPYTWMRPIPFIHTWQREAYEKAESFAKVLWKQLWASQDTEADEHARHNQEKQMPKNWRTYDEA